MLRPSAAADYMVSIDQLVDTVLQQINLRRDANNVVNDVMTLSKEYSLDGIGIMFFGTNLHTLEGNAQGNRLIELNTQLFEVFVKGSDVTRKHYEHFRGNFEECSENNFHLNVTIYFVQNFNISSKTLVVLRHLYY